MKDAVINRKRELSKVRQRPGRINITLRGLSDAL